MLKSDVVVLLLLVLIILLWEILRWLKDIGGTLGCVPARKRRVEQLFKKTRYPSEKLTPAEKEELTTLNDAEDHNSPARTAQLYRIIDLLFGTGEYKRPETKQLELVIAQLDHIAKLLETRPL